jgi:hypothetical protein
MENGSGGFMSDLAFFGGNAGIVAGAQQFTMRESHQLPDARLPSDPSFLTSTRKYAIHILFASCVHDLGVSPLQK